MTNKRAPKKLVNLLKPMKEKFGEINYKQLCNAANFNRSSRQTQQFESCLEFLQLHCII